MKGLEARIPPVAVFLGALAIIETGVKFWPQAAGVPSTASRTLVWVMLVWGAILGAAAVAQFLQAQTTVHPNHPERSSALVTTGIYRISRNPMYLGLAVFVVAYGFHRMHPGGLLALIFFVAFITRFQILPEERALAQRFGATFSEYAQRVRRWI